MHLANIHVSLGGDAQNTVPKYGVTPAEIVILQAIHGPDSVREVEPAGDVPRGSREELERLRGLYGGAKDEDGKAMLDAVYPGVGARVPATIGELALPADFFRATARFTADAEPAPQAVEAARIADETQLGASDEIEGVEGGDISADEPAEPEPGASSESLFE